MHEVPSSLLTRYIRDLAALNALPAMWAYARTAVVPRHRGPALSATTGYGQNRDRLRAADAGFDCHLVKPVRLQDIVRELDARLVTASA